MPDEVHGSVVSALPLHYGFLRVGLAKPNRAEVEARQDNSRRPSSLLGNAIEDK